MNFSKKSRIQFFTFYRFNLIYFTKIIIIYLSYILYKKLFNTINFEYFIIILFN